MDEFEFTGESEAAYSKMVLELTQSLNSMEWSDDREVYNAIAGLLLNEIEIQKHYQEDILKELRNRKAKTGLKNNNVTSIVPK